MCESVLSCVRAGLRVCVFSHTCVTVCSHASALGTLVHLYERVCPVQS